MWDSFAAGQGSYPFARQLAGVRDDRNKSSRLPARPREQGAHKFQRIPMAFWQTNHLDFGRSGRDLARAGA